jgi:hypothetical protein
MMQGNIYLFLLLFCRKNSYSINKNIRDYLKFTVPLSHSLALLAWGGIEWFESYERTNQTSYLKNTIRWGTDWLIEAHPEHNVLFVQVNLEILFHFCFLFLFSFSRSTQLY